MDCWIACAHFQKNCGSVMGIRVFDDLIEESSTDSAISSPWNHAEHHQFAVTRDRPRERKAKRVGIARD